MDSPFCQRSHISDFCLSKLDFYNLHYEGLFPDSSMVIASANTANYGYPLENPYAATIIGTPKDFKAEFVLVLLAGCSGSCLPANT